MNQTKSVKIGGAELLLEKMDVFKQAEIFNRFLPALAPFVAAAVSAREGSTGEILAHAEKAFQALPAQEREAILWEELLPTVKVQMGGGVTVPLIGTADGGGRCLMAPLDFFDVLALAGEVLKFNFARFFSAAGVK